MGVRFPLSLPQDLTLSGLKTQVAYTMPRHLRLFGVKPEAQICVTVEAGVADLSWVSRINYLTVVKSEYGTLWMSFSVN